MVACDLAKVIVGVRFSYPAPFNTADASILVIRIGSSLMVVIV